MPTGVYPRTEYHRKILSEAQKRYFSKPENREKISKSEKRYYEEHPEELEKMSERMKQYYKEHPEEGKRHSRIMIEKGGIRKGREHPMYGKRREEVPNWKGGITTGKRGEVYIYKPEHPDADNKGYILESRYIMEQIIGRRLKPFPLEIIHHKDGNPQNNDFNNLVILTQAEHAKLHLSGNNNPNYKGGRYRQNGYIYVKAPEGHLYTHKGYIAEHRLVMEKYLGRYLKPFPEERVVHVNGTKDDNRIENLGLISKEI